MCSVIRVYTCNSHDLVQSLLLTFFIQQGAPEGIIERCNFIRVGSKKQPLTPKTKQQILELVKTYGTGLCWLGKGSLRSISSLCAFYTEDLLEMMFSVFHLRSFSKIIVLVFLIQWMVVWHLSACENYSYSQLLNTFWNMWLTFDQLTALGADTLRCLALATVDEPIPPSKMDLENSENFAEYEVCTCHLS